MVPDDMLPDERKVKVYAIVLDMFWKSVFSGVTAAAFVAITVKLIIDPTWPIAAVDAFLTGTMFVVFRHYFPGKP